MTRDAGASGLHSHAGAWEREKYVSLLHPTELTPLLQKTIFKYFGRNFGL